MPVLWNYEDKIEYVKIEVKMSGEKFLLFTNLEHSHQVSIKG